MDKREGDKKGECLLYAETRRCTGQRKEERGGGGRRVQKVAHSISQFGKTVSEDSNASLDATHHRHHPGNRR